MRLLRRLARERDREAEMRAHIDLYIDELIDRGLTRDEATRRAHVEFGNPRVKLEEVADMNRVPFIETLWRDVRYAVRVLRRTPVFTFTAITTLALVIGATTAVSSLADALLWRPLPYPNGDRLAVLNYTQQSPGGFDVSTSLDGAMFEAIRDHVPSLDVAVMGGGSGANLFANGSASYIRQGRVSEGYSRVLGISPAKGRWFSREEDQPGGPAVTVLSYAAWQKYFAGREDVVGQSILLRGEAFQVVGVMPKAFIATSDAILWTPIRPSSSGEGSGTNYEVYARLAPGATWAQAAGELKAVNAEAFRLLGFPKGVTRELVVQPMQEARAEGVREPITLLGASVLAVLLIACVNLAALMLARGSSRSKEIATRMALGGGRSAVVRQLMVEALVIAGVGGVAGIALAYLGLDGLQALGGDRFEEWSRASIDARVLAMALGLSALTSVAFGLAPAIQASRLNVSRALAEGGSRSIAGRSSVWPRRMMVVVEVALGVVLLVATGLLVRTFVNLRSLDPGFNANGLVTASVSLQDARYRDAVSVNRLFDDSLRRLSADPNIQSAAVSLELPYERLLNSGFRFMDEAAESQSRTTNASYVTAGFLTTFGLPLQGGRDFNETDREGSAPVALVNKTFERVYSKDRPAIGRRIRIGGVEREIVGITGDIQTRPSFSIPGESGGPLVSLPLVLMPASQTSDGYFRTAHTWFAPVWTVRARSTGAAMAALQRAITGTDPQLPISSSRSMDDVMLSAMTVQRLLMTLVAALACAAMVLAAIGVHGVIAHSVSERRREFGIRIALGSTAAGAVRSVSLGGMLLAGAGAVLGGVLSIPATSLVKAFLWRVETSDPWTYAGVAGVLLIVGTMASVLPALKLLRLNPAETLRN